ncbi:MAG: glucose-1-phosphate adenylyltransferase [Oscillospiraceae bacterium]|jgi:glucose-1-phosphate adenylyltransferase|nr:glucose-1-phosphate adenylyltransferase [Oscillospiraceae bacterium]
MKKEIIAMLLAGGQGSRLYVLTAHVAKPALPFGGKFRLIDFPLSNCSNSGIDTVGVLTQYQPHELNSYIGSGQPWDLDRLEGGVHILPPYIKGKAGTWYKGSANAIYQNISFIENYNPEYVLVLGGDHIYKMDYAIMLEQHKKTQADCTIPVIEVSVEEASRMGIMNVDENDVIFEFEEKPAKPKSTLASMGIYIFTWEKLKRYLIEDEANPKSKNDFGANIITSMLAGGEKMVAYRFSGYWRDVGTIDSLWEANMDMLSGSDIDLSSPAWRIYARNPIAPPHYVGDNATISHSLVTEGCSVYGGVFNSVLFNDVTVEQGAFVEYSIIMPGAVIERGAIVKYAIIAENAHIQSGAKVGSPPGEFAGPPEDWGVAVIASGVKIGPGKVVGAQEMADADLV